MTQGTLNLDAIKRVVQAALRHPVPQNLYGISVGYANDGSSFDYVRATLHVANVFEPDTAALCEAIEAALQQSFKGILIFHVDAMADVDQNIKAAPSEWWAYRREDLQ